MRSGAARTIVVPKLELGNERQNPVAQASRLCLEHGGQCPPYMTNVRKIRLMFDRIIFPVIILTAFISVITKYVLIELGFKSWIYYIVLTLLGLSLYFINVILIKHFINKDDPNFASSEEIIIGQKKFQRWELTAGTGVVPKWVSWVGLSAIACFLSLLFPLIAKLFK